MPHYHRPTILLLSILAVTLAPAANADLAITVDIRNDSGERQVDWPVILTVWRVFGNDMPVEHVRSDGFHVLDPDGKIPEFKFCAVRVEALAD